MTTADVAPVRDLAARLDGVLSGDPTQGAAVLARIEALYGATAGQGLGADGLAVFDEVMLKLSAALPGPDRAAFSGRIAAAAAPPPRLADHLARDPDPAVAAPLLEKVATLSDETLVLCARERGQPHLYALTRRPLLAEPVTDHIVERGDTRVLLSLADNPGARYSEFGLTTLVGRAVESDRLVVLVGGRGDLPAYLYNRLVARAPREVHGRLAEARAGSSARPRAPVLGDGPLDYAEARVAVDRLARTGRLEARAIVDWIHAGALAHAVAGTAALAELPVAVVEAALRQPRPEPLLLVARSMEWDWPTVKAVLSMRPFEDDLVGALAGYERLSPQTARTAMDLRRKGGGR
jgi:uncharacterized protein (DUF2336 family)